MFDFALLALAGILITSGVFLVTCIGFLIHHLISNAAK